MRRAVRKLAAPGRLNEIRNERWKRHAEERQVVLAREREQARQIAAGLRRALLHVFPAKGAATAAVLLDIGSRVMETFTGDRLFELAARLDAFDLVAALWVRETLQAVGVCDADRLRLVDLKPPKKSRRLNRQGRTLAITPELLITSTTGMSHPLGDPAKMAAYLAAGDFAKLARRLESDVKALFAFYQYGVMHHCVRLRWGFLNDTLAVDWAVPGDPSLHEFRMARRTRGRGIISRAISPAGTTTIPSPATRNARGGCARAAITSRGCVGSRMPWPR